MPVRWLADVRGDDVDHVGGKAASLGELTEAGLPVPPGFVVTAGTYRAFLEAADVGADLRAAVDVDADDPGALSTAAEEAQRLIQEAEVPPSLRSELLEHYDALGDEPFVAVRSSATAEDQPDASFAGQQETYLNVTAADLVDRVRDCWASLFTQRAIYYRQRQGYPASDVDIAVVVQRMVDADASGVLFTSHPSTGEQRLIVEAAWGLGEAVVAGEVSPDNYVIDRETDRVEEVAVADKRVQYVRDGATGETVEEPVPEDDRQRRVLESPALERLRELGERIEAHYGAPQDVEWAIVEDVQATAAQATTEEAATEEVTAASAPTPGTDADDESGAEDGLADATAYVLQSRPITTIDDGTAGSGATSTSAASTDAASDTSADDGTADASADDWAADGAADVDGDRAESTHASSAVPSATSADSPTSAADGSGTRVAGADVLATGLGASPGTAAGPARVVDRLDEIDRVGDGDVIVTEMTTPDMVPAMQRASAIVTDRGGMTSHASIVSRELGVPAVVGTENATTAIEDGTPITVDGETGRVTEGVDEDADDASSDAAAPPATGGATAGGAPAGAQPAAPDGAEQTAASAGTKPATATEVKVNVSVPEAAERAAATGADGVGLVRIEHVVLSLGETPGHYVAEHGREAFVDELVGAIQRVAEAFYPRPVRVRTLDAPSDEFRELEGGADEPVEHNPMLGYRGVRRSLDAPEPFRAQLAAIAKCEEIGYDNVETMLPLVTDADDVRAAREHLAAAGLDPREHTWGAMVETPASALCVEGMIEEGIDFVSFGTNDLTQYALAVDRNNERVADRFDELHPAVLELIGDVIETCREHGVDTSICGQAGSRPEMVRHLVDCGISSISANVDAVRDVQQQVERVEQRLLLESVRDQRRRE